MSCFTSLTESLPDGKAREWQVHLGDDVQETHRMGEKIRQLEGDHLLRAHFYPESGDPVCRWLVVKGGRLIATEDYPTPYEDMVRKHDLSDPNVDWQV